jgi:SAM-dependent methyltransferase
LALSCDASAEAGDAAAGEPEVTEGTLTCSSGHRYPIIRGIPRMLGAVPADPAADHDRRTQANFSHEWEHHELGDRTWGIDLDQRVQMYFLDALRIPADELEGKLVLDAGCGNGSQSVAYTRHGCEVVAVDLSTGLEHGYAFRRVAAGARPDRVHFVQADLQHPPFALDTFDIIHSAGVLHHTPDTKRTFLGLRPLLRPGGTFYVWLYSYERIVTPLVNGIRAVTTRIPARVFARIADVLAVVFQAFMWVVDRLGIRAYAKLSRREAALALLDIFGAPYAHYHSFPEVSGWFEDQGFVDAWECNVSRRGFGACGRLPASGSPVPAAAARRAPLTGDP